MSQHGSPRHTARVNSETNWSCVSVVVPHYGDAAPTLALVAQLAEQTRVDLQVIVVDDASPEPFPDTVGVEVVRRENNGGFGSAVNSGVECAVHDRLLILNSDLTIKPTFVSDLVHGADSWMPALAAPAVRTDGRYPLIGRRFPTAGSQFIERLSVLARWRDEAWWQRSIGQDIRAVNGVETAVDWVAGVAMLLPTEEFRAVGGFDERFYMYAEEVDLQRRLRSRGIPSVLLGSVVADHVGGASSDPARQQEWLADSRLKYAAKWGGRRRLMAGWTIAALINAGTGSLRKMTGRDVEPIVGLRHDLGLVWRRRDRQPLRAK